MDDPHIVIGHHPDLGIVASNRHNTAVIDHVLRRVGFEPVPGRRQLYALAEPERDGIRRTRQAVQSLRIVRYQVAVDAHFEPDPQPPRPFQNRDRAPAESLSGPYAHARALASDIASGRLVLLDQLLDPEGTLRAVGTYPATGEGVLLYGEGDLRYVESRHADTDRALAAFAYVRGNGRPVPPSEPRARAATAVSPARSALRHPVRTATGTPASRPLAAPPAAGLRAPTLRSR
ncbi:hypothetical protein ACF09H_13185 [Streptomyces sp. NPDC014983]|uniref:hypothetical protein n=1 Tax=Streptomyces sp. NPDC014983 TaxID=3364933 RepID=UPI0036F95218